VTVLNGMTWDHERGSSPLISTSRSFNDDQHDVTIEWDVQTLEDFAHSSVEDLARRYDLVAIDHPFVGSAAATGCLVALDKLVEPDVIDARARDSVGGSHRSYSYDGYQWAFAVDAACHVSCTRDDLIPVDLRPQSWSETIELASWLRRNGDSRVVMPMAPTDAYCMFLTVLASLGSPGYCDSGSFADRSAAIEALDIMRALVAAGGVAMWDETPIDVLERATRTDEVAYVPALFGYSNYARLGFRPHRVTFAPIPGESGGLLGGFGLAVSAYSTDPRAAAEYAQHASDPEVQRIAWTESGGQPASRTAWDDSKANETAGGFLSATRQGIDAAWVRPRFAGMTRVTPDIARHLQDAVRGMSPLRSALDACDRLTAGALSTNSVREVNEPGDGFYAQAGYE
jgi:multiple sugar transport system substrate-binding protein